MVYDYKFKIPEWDRNRKSIYSYIVRYFRTCGYAPSIAEISDEMNLARSTVRRHLKELIRDGLLMTHNSTDDLSRAFTPSLYEFRKRKPTNY